MKLPLKVILGSAVVCVIGAILIDCDIEVTGWTLMWLGLFGIVCGPMATDL